MRFDSNCSLVEVSVAEFLDGGEVPYDVVLVLVLPSPQNHEAVALVHRDGDFKLLQSGEQRLQELGEGFSGDWQDHEEDAGRH